MAWFDPSTVDDTNEFELLPPGNYRVMVGEAQVKGNKNNDGRHVSVTLTVVEGPLTKRKLWSTFNVENPSLKAQQIGQAQFARFLKACAVGALDSPMDVIKVNDAVLRVDVDHRVDNKGQTRAEVKAFYPDGAVSGPATKAPAPKKAAPVVKQSKAAAPVSDDDEDHIPFAPRWD